MINNKFFDKKKEFLTLTEVLNITDSELVDEKNVDLDKNIYDVATLNKASQKEISFLSSSKYVPLLSKSDAGFCFIDKSQTSRVPNDMIALVNSDPYFAYASLLRHLYDDKKTPPENSKIINRESYYVTSSAKIGENSMIMPGVYIGHNVQIGNNCYIGANSVIEDNCQIGDNCKIGNLSVISYSIIGNNTIIHNGVKIGQDGFGFAHNKGVNHKILQLGLVTLGNDVEVGSNSCIDRGAIDDTAIGNGVKIDNLVQIAHNAIIGDGTVIAGCSAIAGSATIGRFVQIGGGALISGHIHISDGAKIAGSSGVTKNVDPMQVVGGTPAVPIRDWHRMNLKLLKLIKG